MKRLLSHPCASRSLSSLLQSQCNVSAAAVKSRPNLFPARFLSNKGTGWGRFGGGGGDNKRGDDDFDEVNRLDEMAQEGTDIGSSNFFDDAAGDDDPFGMDFNDGADNLGPRLPPKYRRDAATGKLTGEIESELTTEERKLLQMDPLERDQQLLKRVVETWKQNENNMDPKTGDPQMMADFARRVRLARMSLNVLGRSTKAQNTTSVSSDGGGEEMGKDKEGFTNPLSRGEFDTFQEYMKKRHDEQVTEEDVPVHSKDESSGSSSSSFFGGRSILDDPDIHVQGITDESAEDPDNPDLSLKWLTARAKWEVSKRSDAEHPFDDMLPRDLNLSRLVNRKRAKILPTELLHHNNLSLLRRYISPAGQIMPRVRTRLGARDQRRVAKLIKRARKLGLIPHSGQFVVEDNGNIHEDDIHEMRPWEEELVRRGLVVKKKLRQPKSNESGLETTSTLNT